MAVKYLIIYQMERTVIAAMCVMGVGVNGVCHVTGSSSSVKTRGITAMFLCFERQVQFILSYSLCYHKILQTEFTLG